MLVQSRLVWILLFVALWVSVGSQLASAYYTHAANSPKAVDRSDDHPKCTPTPATQEKTPTVLPPLPDEVMKTDLTALDGSTFKLADYRGRVVLVNLWATWCAPCRSDVPHLIKISQEFSARGVDVIGLTHEDPETAAEDVRDFVDDFKINYKIGWGTQSFSIALMQGQIRNNIPQSFVISRDGRVLKRFVGFNQAETPRKMREALEVALNEK